MSNWVRVTDHLPESYIRVIVTDGVDVNADHLTTENVWAEWPIFNRTDVTHWMPLPEPPQ